MGIPLTYKVITTVQAHLGINPPKITAIAPTPQAEIKMEIPGDKIPIRLGIPPIIMDKTATVITTMGVVILILDAEPTDK